MQQFIRWVTACLLGLMFPMVADATHIYTAHLSYEHLNMGNSYTVTLRLYRDCAGIPFVGNRTVKVQSLSGCGTTFNVNLNFVSSQEVTPVCAAQLANTSCNGGAMPGIEEGIFQGVVTLPTSCVDWVVSYEECCRSAAITNLTTPASTDIYGALSLDNLSFAGGQVNTTFAWNDDPVAFADVNELFIYEPNATDIDGDELEFALTDVLDGGGLSAAWAMGYSATAPFSTVGSIAMDPTNGKIKAVPNAVGQYVIAYRVTERRGGIVIGVYSREIVLIVTNITNNAPAYTLNSITGGNHSGNQIDMCGGSTLDMDFTVTDADATQTISITSDAATILSGAAFNTSAGAGNTMNGNIQWTAPNIPGNYTIEIRATDDNCLYVQGTVVQQYIITVNPSVAANLTISGDSIVCGYETTLTAVGGAGTYQWYANAVAIPGETNASIHITPSAIPHTANYSVVATSGSCGTGAAARNVYLYGFPIVDAGADTMIVGGDTVTLTAVVTGGTPLYTYNWQWMATTPSYVVSPTQTTDYWVEVTDANGCMGADTVTVWVGDCVYPGDADTNKVVNNMDLLPLGLGMSNTGWSRANASLNYVCQPALDWGVGTPSGINYKHSDTDGNGVITDADTMAISLNWGLVHLRGGGSSLPGSIPLLIDAPTCICPVAPGTMVSYPVLLGDVQNPVVDGYGLAFTLNYDPMQIEPSSIRMDFNPSWMGDISNGDLIAMQRDFNNVGQLQVGMTRTDHMPMTGNGQIGVLHFTIKDDILRQSDTQLEMLFTDIRLITNQAVELGTDPMLFSITVSDSLVSGVDGVTPDATDVQIFPNPAQAQFVIQADEPIASVQVYNALGQQVYGSESTNNQLVVHADMWTSGVYVVEIQLSNLQIIRKKIHIQR